MIRNTDPMGRPPKAAAPLGRRRRRRLCFWLFYIINLYGYSLYIPYIFHIYFLAMFHIFSLVCFFIYGVKRRQVLIAKPRVYFFSPNLTPFISLLTNLWSFNRIICFTKQIHDLTKSRDLVMSGPTVDWIN